MLFDYPSIYGGGRLYDRIAHNSGMMFFPVRAKGKSMVDCTAADNIKTACMYDIPREDVVREIKQ